MNPLASMFPNIPPEKLLPMMMAASNMMAAGAPSPNPQSGNLGHVWNQGLRGYLGGTEFLRENERMEMDKTRAQQEAAWRTRYYDLQGRQLELNEQELNAKRQEQIAKRRETERLTQAIRAMYPGSGASGDTAPRLMPVGLPGGSVDEILNPGPGAPAAGAMSEQQLQQAEQSSLAEQLRQQDTQFMQAIDLLAQQDPKRAAELLAMNRGSGRFGVHKQFVGFDPNGLPQYRQVLLHSGTGQLTPVSPVGTLTNAAPYYMQYGALSPVQQRMAIEQDATLRPPPKAPPAPPTPRQPTEGQKAKEAQIRAERKVIQENWGNQPWEKLTEGQRKQLDNAFGHRLGETDPEHDEYLRKKARREMNAVREGRLRYYRNLLDAASSPGQKEKVKEQARKEGIQL